jgi:hypothetical protein
MLACFGASWPFNIAKSLKSKTAKGKSVLFLVIVDVGYIAGILHKIFYHNDLVIWLYVANFVMVFIDILLYIRNSRLDHQREVRA